MIHAGLRTIRAYFSDPFRSLPVDPARQAEVGAKPAARKSYAILFTPRSGSTRLADILSSTRALGRPSEVFNPYHLERVARTCAAGSLDAYVQALQRVRNVGGVFGFKITYLQILMTFKREARFFDAFGDATFFWLIREDIVAQAVSGSRMVQTAVTRAVGSTKEARASDDVFQYRPQDLRRRIKRLRWMERRSERFFERFGIEPVRLGYEQLLHLSERQTATIFADAVGVELAPDAFPHSRFMKVGAGKAETFAARFRKEHPAFLKRIEAGRQPLLAGLADPAMRA